MLNIVICEDNDIQRINLVNLLNDIISEEKLDMKVYLSTSNPYDVIKFSHSNNSTVIYLLDVDLNSDINGIELADKIRNKDTYSFIIFITSYSELSYLTFKYKVEAFDYIIKDSYNDTRQALHECLVKINNRCNKDNNSNKKDIFTIKDGRTITNIHFNEILFFETTNIKNKIKVSCYNRYKEFYGKLKDIENFLDERFYRCHKSYIVNIENIEFIDKKQKIVRMKNGQQCYISLINMKGLLARFEGKNIGTVIPK